MALTRGVTPDDLVQNLLGAVTPGSGARLRRSQVHATGGSSAMTHVQPFENPMTATGDIIYGGADGQLRRLPIGNEGDVLTVVDIGGGVLEPRWVAP